MRGKRPSRGGVDPLRPGLQGEENLEDCEEGYKLAKAIVGSMVI
ncbi:MAG TPA: hypothetical protein VHT73_17810 [Thermodesulfobacteriota bacterium]|nr:hypothetical protein [Thermodesulfobacteriota bacterium]